EGLRWLVGLGQVGDKGRPGDYVAVFLGGFEGEDGLGELAELGIEVDKLGVEEGDGESVGGDELGMDLGGMVWVRMVVCGGSQEGVEVGGSEGGAVVVMDLVGGAS
ncbi:hypothetical protein COCNU_01G022450, partial [Cocos nucifera]